MRVLEDKNQSFEKLLDERAHHLAQVTQCEHQRESAFELAVVQIGGEQIGIEARAIREITQVGAVTRFPGQPKTLCGLLQVRGELMCLVHTAAVMGIEDVPRPKFGVVVNGEHGCIALGVQTVNEFRIVYKDELIEGFAAETRPVLAVTRDLVSVLDVNRLLTSKDVQLKL